MVLMLLVMLARNDLVVGYENDGRFRQSLRQ